MAGRYERLFPWENDRMSGSKPSGDEVYVVDVPKDHIVRPPRPPTRKVDYAVKPLERRRGSCCSLILRWTIFSLLFSLAVAVIVGAILFLVIQPRFPKYHVDEILVREFNEREDFRSLFADMDVIVRANNPNKRFGFYYEDNSTFSVSYYGTEIGRGEVAGFYQGRKNVTVVAAKLAGQGVEWSEGLHQTLRDQRNDSSVLLAVAMDFPVRIGFDRMKSRRVTFKVRCKMVVNGLASGKAARVESERCILKL